MLVGKRRQPPIMKRTTSISSGMAVDTQVITEKEVHDHAIKEPHPDHGSVTQSIEIFGAKGYEYEERLVGMAMNPPPVSTTTTTINHNQNQTSISSAQVIDTAHFLRACGLCKRRLAHGRDIYMYRGDTAFCSLECREQQIKQDKRKDKWKLVNNKEDHRAAASPPTNSSKASTKSETIAAAACT